MNRFVRRLRLLALFACLLVGLAAAPGALPAGKRSWAQPQIKLVVARGLMARSIASFRPNDSLTQAELQDLVAGLTEEPPKEVANPGAPVTMAQLDAHLVRAAGLSAEASTFYEVAAAAGLHPPARFGTEVVARLLGLRTNHPTGQDDLERLPSDPAPRAEAAYSAAQMLRMSEWETASVQEAASAFELPTLTRGSGACSRPPSASSASRTCGAARASGPSRRSASRPGAGSTAPGSRGGSTSSSPTVAPPSSRTRFRVARPPRWPARCLAGERIKVAKLAPADLLFFGDGGRRAKPAQVDHMAIYLGNGWLIHSSRYGVALAPIAGWYDIDSPGAVGLLQKPGSKPRAGTFRSDSRSPEWVMARAGARERIAVRIPDWEETPCSNGDLASSP